MSAVRRVLPWLWTGLLATAAAVALIFGEIGSSSVDALLAPVAALVIVLMAAFGAIISSKQPGNRIAWLFQAISVLFLIVIASNMVVEAIDPSSPEFPDTWDYVAIFILDGISLLQFHAVFLLLYLFPTGRFLSRRWAWAGWSAVVLGPASFLAILFSKNLEESFTVDGWQIPNPIGFLPSGVFEFISFVWAVVLMFVAFGGVIALIVRYRTSDLVGRAQIKWVLYAAVIAAVGLPIGWGDFALAGLFLMVAFLIIPVVITIAITRYKLFEIDRLISRTISYTIVVGLLGAAFFGVTALITTLLPTGNSFAVAGSTLVVAALFNPLRQRIQRAVDRRFNRPSYQAHAISEHFSERLQESLSIEQIADVWSKTVEETLQPQAIGIWIKTSAPTPRTELAEGTQ